MKRLQSIDVLRGIAALIVLIAHLPRPKAGWLNLRAILMLPLDFGYLGVPLFLLISGFCIHLGAAKQITVLKPGAKVANWGAFWRRRFWRLYPPYVAAIIFSLIAYYSSSPGALNNKERTLSLPWDLATHLLMIHNIFPAYRGGLGNGPFWTLGLEEQLYALYALFLLLRRKLPPPKVLLIALGVTVIWRVIMPFLIPSIGDAPLAIGEWHRWPTAHWFFWVLGAIAAEAHTKAIRLPHWCYRRIVMKGCFCAGVLLSARILPDIAFSPIGQSFVGRETSEPCVKLITSVCDPLLFVIAFFVLINRWVWREARFGFDLPGVRLLAPIGVMSYSLYLTHVPTILLLKSLTGIEGLANGTPFRYAIYIPVCLAVSALFFWLVERRFLNPPMKQSATQGNYPRLRSEPASNTTD